ncbi:MAG: leucine-rich repeat protein [Metamycoplasmataceae bacterium]
MKYTKKNTKKILGATSILVAASLSLTLPFALHINENNKTINLNKSPLKDEEHNDEVLGFFDGTYLDKWSLITLGWLDQEVILELDWEDAPNVIHIGPETNLGPEAGTIPFYDTNIRSIYIPSKIKAIGEYSFMNSAIEHLNFEENSQLEIINNFAFTNTFELSEIDIPASVKTIGIDAFYSSSLKTINFENNSQLSTIKAGAFQNSKLTSIIIPDSVVEIGEDAFFNIPTLPGGSISMLDSLKGNNPNEAKYGFSQEQWDAIHWRISPFTETRLNRGVVNKLGWNNKEKITLLDWHTFAPNVTSIAGNTFEDLNLKFIEFPDRIISIGDRAFKGTHQLSTVLINLVSSSLTTIGSGAFENSGLLEINIPDGVESINGDTFKETGSLMTVNFNSTSTLKSIDISAFESSNIISIDIPNTVSSIGEAAFRNTTSLSRVSFNSETTVSSIGNSAFESSNISSMNIPNTVTSIGEYAFKNTNSLSTILFNDESQLISIGNNAFESSSITNIALPDSIETLGMDAFKNTFSLTSITLPHILYQETNAYGLAIIQWNSIVWSNILEEGMICKIKAKNLLKDSSIINIPKSTNYKGIESNAFEGTNITKLTIEYKHGFVIEEDAFKNTPLLGIEEGSISLASEFKNEISKFGFSDVQMANIKYIENSLDDKSSSNNTGAIVGSIFGVLAVVGIGLGGWFYWKRIQKKKV